jgi:hypothetical protein
MAGVLKEGSSPRGEEEFRTGCSGSGRRSESEAIALRRRKPRKGGTVEEMSSTPESGSKQLEGESRRAAERLLGPWGRPEEEGERGGDEGCWAGEGMREGEWIEKAEGVWLGGEERGNGEGYERNLVKTITLGIMGLS